MNLIAAVDKNWAIGMDNKLLVRIPEDMIPAKWSDFEFWSEYGKRLGTACQALIRSEKKIPDLPVMGEFVRALLWAAGAVAGEAVFLRGFWRM